MGRNSFKNGRGLLKSSTSLLFVVVGMSNASAGTLGQVTEETLADRYPARVSPRAQSPAIGSVVMTAPVLSRAASTADVIAPLPLVVALTPPALSAPAFAMQAVLTPSAVSVPVALAAPALTGPVAVTAPALTPATQASRYSNMSLAKISDNLYLSSIQPAENRALLIELGITHIVNMTGPVSRTNPAPRYPNRFADEMLPGTQTPRFHYIRPGLADEADVNIAGSFQAVHRFMVEAIRGGGRVLVHCEAGISRSSTIVVSFLIRYDVFDADLDAHNRGMSLSEAFNYVKALKPNIGSNVSFFGQLIEFERRVQHHFHEAEVPSMTLFDYKVAQMLEGPAAAFGKERVVEALTRAAGNTDLALQMLFAELE